MLSNKDISKLEKKFATKKDFKKTEDRLNKRTGQVESSINKRIDRVLKYIDFKIKPLEEFRKEMLEFKDKVLDRLDWLIGKYQKFEDEYTIQAEQNRRILDRIENHEKRISSIEKLPSIS